MVNSRFKGFALPSIMIASVVMLMVLVSALSAVSASRTALGDQYYNQLAREAAQSGLATAEACMQDGSPGWSNPLRPGSSCAGAVSQGSGSSNYVMSTSTIRTTFSVPAPTSLSGTDRFQAIGTVELLRRSTGTVWRTYTQEMSQIDQGDERSVQWKQVSSGFNHTCAIASDSQAYCWGQGANGRLGNGSADNQSTPVAVSRGEMPAGATVLAISAGGNHTCAIASDNQAYCWGAGTSGQLGNKSTADESAPVAVFQGDIPNNSTVQAISAGDTHTCAIAHNDRAYCWGNGGNGRLGNGLTSTQTIPAAVASGAMSSDATILSISASTAHTCAIASDNQAYCWGNGSSGRLGNNSTSARTTPVAVSQGAMPAGATILSISLGDTHTCAIASDNQAYCWGQGIYRQLGNASTSQQATPVAVSQGAMPAGATILSISAIYRHTCAIASDNQAYCWGTGAGGRLGNGLTISQATPVAVSYGAMPAGATVRSVAVGVEHTCAIASDNQAYCWGQGSYGRLGNGSGAAQNIPVAVSAVNDPAERPVLGMAVATGSSHTCAIASDNLAYCWGTGSSGQLGNGSGGSQTAPVAVSRGAMPAGASIRSVGAGYSHTCAIASDNQAYCWGAAGSGVLGAGPLVAAQTAPVAVSRGAMPAGASIRSISVGQYHTCAIASDNQAYCWGRGDSGQLGNGSTSQQDAPAAVSRGAMPSDVTIRSISAGDYHTCAIASNNRAYCWGSGSLGRLGNGSTIQQDIPVAVSQGAMPSGSTLRSISAGSSHTCAVASDNQAYCWGWGNSGRLGNGSTSQQTTPVAVSRGAMPSGATIRSVKAGSAHTCAIASNNRAYCWGSSSSGQLGNGSTSQQTTPVAVSRGAMPAGATILSVSVGNVYVCAIASDNQAYCWGAGTGNKLGNGSTASRTTPVKVSPAPPHPATPSRTLYF